MNDRHLPAHGQALAKNTGSGRRLALGGFGRIDALKLDAKATLLHHTVLESAVGSSEFLP